MDDTPALLKPSEAASILAVNRRTLEVLERTGRLVPIDLSNPDGRKRFLRYRRSDVNQLAGLADV